MYQLSHMLTEQRGLLASLSSMSLLGDKLTKAPLEADSGVKQEDEEEERRRKLAAVLEKVEGCMVRYSDNKMPVGYSVQFLNLYLIYNLSCKELLETPGRAILHEGDVLELDPVENTALQRVHAYLLSDGLMLATWIPNRLPVSYLRYILDKIFCHYQHFAY